MSFIFKQNSFKSNFFFPLRTKKQKQKNMFRRTSFPLTAVSSSSSSSSLFKFATTTQQNLFPFLLMNKKNQQIQFFSSVPQIQMCRRFSSSSTTEKGGTVEASADTHPDFQPKPVKTDDNTEERQAIMQDIRDTIRDEPVVVFIKGLPECPVCSFSKKMIDILDALQLEYTSFDVLAHPVVRSYVKEVSDWGTIPQVFVKGEFVGGVDIVAEMAKKGQLQILLEKNGVPFKDYHF
jgi:monothiol glutaredoxin